MKNNYRSALLLVGLLTCSLTANAQQESAAKKAESSQKKINPLILFDQGATARFAKSSNAPEDILDLPKENDFVSVKEIIDNLGHIHKKYKQTFRGIDVVGGSASMNYKGTQLLSLSNEAYIIYDINTTPSIKAARARQFAEGYFGATKYVYEDQEMAETLGYVKELPRLVILPIYDDVNPNELVKEFKLAYQVDVFASAPEMKHNNVYVDATNGTILADIGEIFHTGENAHSNKKENAKHANASVFAKKSAAAFVAGVAATRYSGNRAIETTNTRDVFVLRDATRGGGINTFNSANTDRYPRTDFVDNDNNWTSREHDNAKKDNGALDAHWGAEVTYDYWKSIHNRDSFDANGAAINSWVHFNTNSGSSRGYDNAFWNGRNMTYGDGNSFDVLTALDVAAHEIGHAICSNTADLAYRNESGALNEGFSDIWGAAVEFYILQSGSDAAPGARIWDIGEDLGRNLRSMSNPKSRSHPDTYRGTNWKAATRGEGCSTPSQGNDNCGVHSNSGVLNHWFYILTAGKSGANDVGDIFSVSGIGMAKAAKIAYRMESVYLTMNSTFADARIAGIQSAKDLYGAGGIEEIATTNAWYAVNVGDKFSDGDGGGNPTPTPTTDIEAPTAPSNLIVSDIQDTSVQLSWRAATDNVGVIGYQVWLGNDNLGTVRTLTEPVTGLVKGEVYTFRIKAIDAAGNTSEFSNSVEVTAGGSTDICDGVPAYVRGGSYRSGDQVVSGGKLYERTRIGWDDLGFCGGAINGFVGQKGSAVAPSFDVAMSFAVFPNPVANGQINIAIDGTEERASFTINNLLGQVVKHGVLENSTTRIDLDNLSAGSYIVQVVAGTASFKSRIILTK